MVLIRVTRKLPKDGLHWKTYCEREDPAKGDDTVDNSSRKDSGTRESMPMRLKATIKPQEHKIGKSASDSSYSSLNTWTLDVCTRKVRNREARHALTGRAGKLEEIERATSVEMSVTQKSLSCESSVNVFRTRSRGVG